MLSSRPKASAKPEASPPHGPGGLARLVNSAGRIGLNLLQRMVQAVSSEDFIRFIQRPPGRLSKPSTSLPSSNRPDPHTGRSSRKER